MKNIYLIFSTAILCWFFVGCASEQPPSPSPRYVDPSAQGAIAGLGIESQDLLTATDKMTRKILETPQLQAHQGKIPTIGILPVENRTRFAIDKEIFTTRMKALLNEKAHGQLRFVARDRIDSIKKERELKKDVTDSQRKLSGVDYFLTGELSSLSTATQQGKSDYLLFTFRLIDAETSEEIWESFHELKKEGIEDAVYQ